MWLFGLAATTTASFMALSAVLWGRADLRPPFAIRTESGRSVEEHAFRTRVRVYREGSVACLVAGLVTLLMFGGLALYSLKGR